MMRCCLILLFFPLFGLTQKFTAADIKQLKLYSTGVFSNEAQAKADSQAVKAGLKVQSIWQKRKDGAWMFAERTDTVANYQLWHFYIQDDTTLVLQFLDFKETEKAVQLSKNINQQFNLYIYNLITRHGCEIYLKKNKTGYAGTSLGKECFISAAGNDYCAFNIAFTRNSIGWQQASFDKDDKQLPGGVNCSYKFNKKANSLK